MARLPVLLLLSLLPVSGPAFAQFEASSPSRYEAIYGRPVDVSLIDLLQNPGEYQRRAVRVKGRLDYASRGSSFLRDGFGNAATIMPMSDVAAEWDSAQRAWVGRTVEIAGVVQSASGSLSTPGAANIVIQFWEFLGPEEEKDAPKDLPLTFLETLVTSPGTKDGRVVRVIGQFRGRNLFGDLPSRSRRDSDDWVIKDDLFAVWVHGKRAKGSGWKLDADKKRDSGRWIEVIGQVRTVDGVTYLEARRVALSAEPPRPTAVVMPAPAPSPRPKVPPVVVFSLPLEGEGVGTDGRFVVQFSKDMDESSFEGHVVLRYADGVRPGDRGFVGLKLSYDGGRRALTVDPGDRLQPGRAVELVLLPGIEDLDGMELASRTDGQDHADSRDVLTFFVGLDS